MSNAAKFAIAVLSTTLSLQVCVAMENATVRQNGKWVSQPSIQLSDVRNFKPAADVKLSKYGGWLEQKEKATGFFHTAKIDNHWWLVDPDGYLFLSVGVDSVNQRDLSQDNTDTAATDASSAENQEWGKRALTLLQKNGFNTLGCWSDTEVLRKLQPPMPYCLRWNFMAIYEAKRKAKYPATGTIEAVYPFDPEFKTFCDQRAKNLEKTKDDPWLLGHFSDNELPLRETGIVRRYLSFPTNDPCHAAAAKFMAARKHEYVTQSDDADFLQLVVGEYYRIVSSAIKKHDPNHLFLGSRFHSAALQTSASFIAAGPYTDIISVNYYGHWTPENPRIQNWSALAQKPILITEWYAKAADSGLPNKTGAGLSVKTQSDRAKYYENFTLTILQNPSCVGWHWFKYRDGAENNPGMVNAKDVPYQPLLDAMKEINFQVYPLTEALRK